MTPCSRLDDYCIGRLNDKESAAFEAHLATCGACEFAVSSWRAVGSEIRAIGETLIGREPESSAGQVRRIIEAVQQPETTLFSARVLVPAAAAVVVLLLLGVSLFLFNSKGGPVDHRDKEMNHPSPMATARMVRGDNISPVIPVGIGEPLRPALGERALLALGKDRLGLEENGSLVIGQTGAVTRIRLLRGRLACSVAPRHGRESFVVEAGSREVRVVGTRFLVSNGEANEITVAVEEGTVAVTCADGRLERISAGRRVTFTETTEGIRQPLTLDDEKTMKLLLSIDTPLPPSGAVASVPLTDNSSRTDTSDEVETEGRRSSIESAKPGRRKSEIAKAEEAPASTAVWQQWVLDGRVDEAERALDAHLKTHPDDVEAWFLLADCKKRKNQYEAAVAVYRRLIGRTTGQASETARFRAGVILQEQLIDHAGAVVLFEGFLRNSGPGHHLKAEAELRLARSLRAVGQNDRARGLLEDILTNHSATSAAKRAEAMLHEE